jgi:hypothetical protein
MDDVMPESKLEYLVTGDRISYDKIFQIDNKIAPGLYFLNTELGDLLFSDKTSLWQLEFNKKSMKIRKDEANRICSPRMEEKIQHILESATPKTRKEDDSYKLFKNYKPNSDGFEPFSRDRLLKSVDVYMKMSHGNRFVASQPDAASNYQKVSLSLISTNGNTIKDFIRSHENNAAQFIGHHDKVRQSQGLENDLGIPQGARYKDIYLDSNGNTKYYRLVEELRAGHKYQRKIRNPVLEGFYQEIFSDAFKHSRPGLLSRAASRLAQHTTGVLKGFYSGGATAKNFANKGVTGPARLVKKYARNAAVWAALAGFAAGLGSAQIYSSQVSSPAPISDKQRTQDKTYTVRKGDNLWKIVKEQYRPKTDREIVAGVRHVVDLNKDKYPNLNLDTIYVENQKAKKGADGIKGDVIYPGQNLILEQPLGQHSSESANTTFAKSAKAPDHKKADAIYPALNLEQAVGQGQSETKTANDTHANGFLLASLIAGMYITGSRAGNMLNRYVKSKTRYNAIDDIVKDPFADSTRRLCCKELSENIVDLVQRHNKGMSTDIYASMPQRKDVVEALNLARDSGYKLERFCYDAIKNDETSYLVNSYKDSARSVDSIRKDFEAKYNMKISKKSFYKVLDKHGRGIRRKNSRAKRNV